MNQRSGTTLNFAELKRAIGSLGEKLEEALAIGIMGSLARGDFSERSDIDVFVVVEKKRSDTDRVWWKRITEVLEGFHRDITVITYSVNGLKKISNWYVLRLASEGILIYDRGKVGEIFRKIIETAHRAGLVERKVGDHRVWSAKHLKLGERLKLEVEE